jgi:hypothetical protein
MVRTDPWSMWCPNRQAEPDCRSTDTGVRGRDDQLPSRQCRERRRSPSPPQPDAPRTRTRRYGGAEPCHDDGESDSSSCRRSGRLLSEDGGGIDRRCPSNHPTIMLGEVRGNAGSITGRSTRKPPSTEKDPEYRRIRGQGTRGATVRATRPALPRRACSGSGTEGARPSTNAAYRRWPGRSRARR